MKKLGLRSHFDSKFLKSFVAKFAVFALVSGSVLGVSSAAFNGSFTQAGESWTSGTVALTGDKATAQFAAANIIPGYSESHCITLTSNSTVATALQFYAKTNSNVKQLGENLQLTVNTGTGGTDGANSCTGFTVDQTVYTGSAANLGATAGTAATALNITKPLSASGSQQFMITATLPVSTPDTVQGGGFTMDFNWQNHS